MINKPTKLKPAFAIAGLAASLICLLVLGLIFYTLQSEEYRRYASNHLPPSEQVPWQVFEGPFSEEAFRHAVLSQPFILIPYLIACALALRLLVLGRVLKLPSET